MLVAAVQFDIAWEDPALNLQRAGKLVARAAVQGVRIAALPEMFNTGFTMNAAAAAAHAAYTRDGLADLARRHGLYLVAGYADPGPAGGLPRNAASVFGPDGEEIIRYHKIHPFTLAGEHRHYDGGTVIMTTTIEGLRVSPLICYDLRFPEPFRAVAAATDLFVVIANWPSARREAWQTLLRARAIENQSYVMGVNRVGEGDGLLYSGDSAIIDPLGATIASAGDDENVLSGQIEAAQVERTRERFSFLADRRPEVYARL